MKPLNELAELYNVATPKETLNYSSLSDEDSDYKIKINRKKEPSKILMDLVK